MRNNFLTKDIVINKFKQESEQQYASWNDIIIAYKMDKLSFLKQRQMPKLSDRHVFPHLIPKMKVRYATEVLSRTVANFMNVVLTLSKGKILKLLINTMTIMLILVTHIINNIFFLQVFLILKRVKCVYRSVQKQR